MPTVLTATNVLTLPAANPLAEICGLTGVHSAGDPAIQCWIDAIPGVSTELVANLRPAGNSISDSGLVPALSIWDKLQPTAYEAILSGIRSELTRNATLRLAVARSDAQPFPQNGYLPNLARTGSLSTVLIDVDVPDLGISELESVTFVLNSDPYSLGSPAPLLIISVQDTYDQPGATRELHRFELASLQAGRNVITLPEPIRALATGTGRRWLTVSLENVPASIVRHVAQPTLTDESKGYLRFYNGGELLNPELPLHVQMRVSCDLNTLITRYRSTLKWAYAYQLAKLLLDEKLTSPLVNLFTNTSRDDTARRIDQYTKEVKDKLKLAVAEILLDWKNSGCAFLICDSDTQPGIYLGSFVTPRHGQTPVEY